MTVDVIYTTRPDYLMRTNNSTENEATQTASTEFGETQIGDTVAFRSYDYINQYGIYSSKVHHRKIWDINEFGVWIRFDNQVQELTELNAEIIEICRPHPKDGIMTQIADLRAEFYAEYLEKSFELDVE